MSRKLKELEKKLTPAWIAVLNVLGVLYGVWGATSFYTNAIRGHAEVGVLALWLFGMPVVFAGSLVLTALPVGWMLSTLKDFGRRLILVSVAFGIFLAGYGEPSLWLALVAGATFVYVYWTYKKAFEDEEELKKL